MKIVIPVVGFSRSGGERVLSRIATELIQKGHEVFFVAPDDNCDPYYPTEAKVYRSPKGKKSNKYVNYLFTINNIYKLCKKLEPDLILANFHITAYIAIMLPKNVLKVYYIQAYEVVFSNKILKKIAALITYLLPLKKIVNSENLLPPSLNNYIEIIPAGIDTQVFYPRDRTYKKEMIGIIGRKEKHKGTSQLIDIILEWGKNKNITLNVAVYLSDYDASRLRSANINFTYTIIDNDFDLANFYRINDLVIATGLVEDGAFHYPCAEAMACGALVISNYAPLVNTDSMLKISHFNRENVLEKLDLFYGMDEKEVNHELRFIQKINQFYSWDRVGEKFNKTLLALKNKEKH